jgi:hypothetical protein
MITNQNNAGQMFSLIENYKSSGISGAAFCKEQNLSYHTFHYWLKKYRQKDKKSEIGFVPLKIKEREAVNSGRCEIIFPDGKRIIFHEKTEATFLRALLY